MSNFKDLTGQKFGRLTAIEPFFKNGVTYWLFKCDCGNEKIIKGYSVTSGKTKSCGCLNIENYARGITPNEYEQDGDTLYCKLPNCEEKVILDVSDYNRIVKLRWHLGKNGYVYGYENKYRLNGVLLHQFILNRIGVKDGLEIDHINGNKLDNRKCNLRVVSRSQNGMNKKPSCLNTSGCVGVSYHKERKYWESYITINNKRICLGWYKDKEDAIKARKEAEEKYFGEYKYKGVNE